MLPRGTGGVYEAFTAVASIALDCGIGGGQYAVIEDRGPLASNGSQIVAIQIGDDEDRRFEMRAEYLERLAA
jgi:hypothetical protein